ncbi:MAG: hypothetical protein DMG64_05840 [Acidobacteria bacterium]|nr:MAG: hypothetical protein DMG64_05840 [Acidobacteriota bacterium]PYY20959.1 MAG: hypothetical protein DMG62_20660 [Acidobacteriota bacterium]
MHVALIRAGPEFSCTAALPAGSAVSVCPPTLADWALLIHRHTRIIPLTGAARAQPVQFLTSGLSAIQTRSPNSLVNGNPEMLV